MWQTGCSGRQRQSTAETAAIGSDSGRRPTWLNVGSFAIEPTDAMRDDAKQDGLREYHFRSEDYLITLKPLADANKIADKLATVKACREYAAELIATLPGIDPETVANINFGRWQPPRAEWATAGCDLMGVASPTITDSDADDESRQPAGNAYAVSLTLAARRGKGMAAACLTPLRNSKAMVGCRRVLRTLRPSMSEDTQP